ncbi:hypothetical protein B0H19DRAFT_1109135 [Mycena capillaripes]|nr:hypothetical protein B0H19DRAFT_1109135 [Mycena capillaripes]
MFLSDFKTLQAAILSSKSIYLVFSAHRNSIVKAVASNLVGPALLSAMNLVRYQLPADADDHWVYGHATAEPIEVGVITQEEACKLAKSATVVNTLQDIFSSRHKDRSSESSKLSPVESLRFTRAMYRIMLFADVFDSKYTIYIDDADTEEEAEIRTARKDFFAMFPTPELYEIHTVNDFIEALGTWFCRKMKKRFYVTCDHASAVPPRVFLQAYQQQNDQVIDEYFDDDTFHEANGLLVDYIKQPLEDVWVDRQEPSLENDVSCSKYILDYIEGGADICQQCGTKAGIDLWTESNWDIQSAVTHAFLEIEVEGPPMLGSLPGNALETAALTTHLHDVRMQDLILALFAIKTSEYSHWSPQDKLCEACLKRFITQHIHIWLLQRKQKAGDSVPEDCWYGYDCRTQVHNTEHAKKWNHLCEAKKK